ncbi:MAG: glycosyltransferase family 2 protein [Desulfobacterales bacterium]|nr:glycosyltransferase family 2 protein [Desulfobacterales bacterium]
MIDIIIVNYNSTKFLLNCIRSLKKSSILNEIPYDLYIEDNASKDNPEIIKKVFPESFVSYNNKNLGFGKAVNKSANIGVSKFIMILNPDTIVSPSFLKDVLDFMIENPDIGAMGPKILDIDGKLQNSARSFPNLLTSFFGRASYLSKIFPNNKITKKNLMSLLTLDEYSPMNVDWVSGACMILRRDVFEQTGGFDEGFFMYWEDADLCKRLKKMGWRVVYYPKPIVYHYVGMSSKKDKIKANYEFHKSVYYYFNKYSPSWLFMLNPIVLFFLFIRGLFVLSLKFLNANEK